MRYLIIIVLLTGLVVSFLSAIKQKKAPATVRIHQQVDQQLEVLKSWYQQDWLPAIESANEATLQQSFLRGRQLYKKAEWAVDYFSPATAKELNGAPLPEIEAEEHIVIEPSGFQVIEELIYPYEEYKKLQLIRESKKWFSILGRLYTLWAGHQFRDDQVLEAAKQEVQRITALGLSGFDTPLSFAAISELQYSLEGMETALHVFKTDTLTHEFAAIKSLFEKGYHLLKTAPDFNAFNRMDFIQQVLNPISKHILQLQKKLHLPLNDYYAVRGTAATFFDSGAFNADFFTPDAISHLNDEKVALGKRLFDDAILSDNAISCATCHKPELAFTDGLERSRSFGAGRFLKRNTPTLLYAGLQMGQFYDMRAAFLEDQVKNVIDNKDEIHGSLPEAAKKLSADIGFLQRFQTAFGTKSNTVTEVQIQIALAAYVRSLAPFNSRFDKHMRGKNSLTKDEVAGFNLFMGKAKCGTCHFVPLFNGTAPPSFSNSESEVIGVPADAAVTKLDGDSGRYSIHQLAEFSGAFKTPTLRNIARTAPYMHNGVFATLEDVIDFYNNGGAVGASIPLENQTLPADSLRLTTSEKHNLILFLKTLTDAP